MARTAGLTKGEIGLGGVSGGSKVHGITPDDGVLLCGATGDDGSEPYAIAARCNSNDSEDFDPKAENACKSCATVYNKLPD
jgi:hypothetical protein